MTLVPDSGLALIQALPVLATAAKALVSSATDVKQNAQLIEFQTALIALNGHAASIQIENQSIRAELETLRAELLKSRDWNAEKMRYKLFAPFPGRASTVYALKQTHAEGEPAHWLCVPCFLDSKKSILQGFEQTRLRDQGWYQCSVCKAEVESAYGNAPAPSFPD